MLGVRRLELGLDGREQERHQRHQQQRVLALPVTPAVFASPPCPSTAPAVTSGSMTGSSITAQMIASRAQTVAKASMRMLDIQGTTSRYLTEPRWLGRRHGHRDDANAQRQREDERQAHQAHAGRAEVEPRHEVDDDGVGRRHQGGSEERQDRPCPLHGHAPSLRSTARRWRSLITAKGASARRSKRSPVPGSSVGSTAPSDTACGSFEVRVEREGVLLQVDRVAAGAEQVRRKLVGVVRACRQAGRVGQPQHLQGRA